MKLSYKYSLFTIVLFLLAWEGGVLLLHVSAQILPAPSRIFQAFIQNWDVLLQHTMQTAMEALIGLLIATLLGVGFAILLDTYSRIREAVYPLLVLSQTIPIIALAPLLLLWFGFDITPKVIVVVLYCFFPITVAFVDGMSSTTRERTRLLQSMNASKAQQLRFIRFPGSLPYFFSGLRIASVYAVAGAIVGEFVGGYKGLGIYMQTAANSHSVANVFAAIGVASLLSVVLFLFVILLERIIIPWHHIASNADLSLE